MNKTQRVSKRNKTFEGGGGCGCGWWLERNAKEVTLNLDFVIFEVRVIKGGLIRDVDTVDYIPIRALFKMQRHNIIVMRSYT